MSSPQTPPPSAASKDPDLYAALASLNLKEPYLTQTVDILDAHCIDLGVLRSGMVTGDVQGLPLAPGARVKVLSLCPSPAGSSSSSSSAPPPISNAPSSPLPPWAPSPKPAGQPLTFMTSNFKVNYETAPVPQQQFVLFGSVHALITWYCARQNIDAGEGNMFFNVSSHMSFVFCLKYFHFLSSLIFAFISTHQQLQAEAFQNLAEILNQIPGACQRMWTSSLHLRGREFCSILNEAIRVDDPVVSQNVVSIVRGINSLSVTRNFGVSGVPWPLDNTLYRGGGLPDQHQSFFTVGKVYRVPMFLATSTDWLYCQQTFCRRAEADDHRPPVFYYIYFHQELKCCHVNIVTRRHGGDEKEFLFVPYSVFEVVGVKWMDQPTWEHPHLIYLIAMHDNTRYPEDLPLAPWH